MNNIQISKNFKLREFQCTNDDAKVKIHSSLLQALQNLRDKIEKPIVITSGYRTPEYNSKLKGAIKNSYHIQGKAVDIKRVNGFDDKLFEKIARECGFKGVILYPSFIHLDVGNNFYFADRR